MVNIIMLIAQPGKQRWSSLLWQSHVYG